MTSDEFLDSLLAAHGVAGNESAAAAVFAARLEDVAEISTDSMGNVYATINADSTPRVLLEAHIDEIGYQVTYVDGDGFIYIRPCGGVDTASAIGSFVEIRGAGGGTVTEGVIGRKPVHLLKADERTRLPEYDALWVDTGLDADEVRRRLSVGDYVAPRACHRRLGVHRLAGKALDNRIGVYIIAEALRSLAAAGCKACVTAVATVQEELGCKGAAVAAIAGGYDTAICVDATFTSDVPDVSPRIVGDIALGRGVVIACHGDVSQSLRLELEKKAAAEPRVPVQLSANYAASGGTDARVLQLSSAGVSTALLGVPLRYMHTAVEMCDMRDVGAAINLITTAIL